MSENILEVKGLRKQYPGFLLDDVSFTVPKGSITGFIGRNGAGKTTTLKSILNLVHSEGDVRCFGLKLREHEREIKSRTGYVVGAVDYYRRKRIRDIVSVTRRFYPSWDEETYRKYMSVFELDENKTPLQLSEGMRVKLNLTVALSHSSELLILDEPTSGLDPVSREELLEIFTALRGRGMTILFSTHITSDLEKCADRICYIRRGRIIVCRELDGFTASCAEEGRGNSLDEIMLSYEKEDYREKLA